MGNRVGTDIFPCAASERAAEGIREGQWVCSVGEGGIGITIGLRLCGRGDGDGLLGDSEVGRSVGDVVVRKHA